MEVELTATNEEFKIWILQSGPVRMPLLAGSDKLRNGRDPSAACREGLHTSHPGSRCPVVGHHRTQPRSVVSRPIFADSLRIGRCLPVQG